MDRALAAKLINMKAKYVVDRSRTVSKQAEALQAKLYSLYYEMERQKPYNDEITDNMVQCIYAAYANVRECRDHLDKLTIESSRSALKHL